MLRDVQPFLKALWLEWSKVDKALTAAHAAGKQRLAERLTLRLHAIEDEMQDLILGGLPDGRQS